MVENVQKYLGSDSSGEIAVVVNGLQLIFLCSGKKGIHTMCVLIKGFFGFSREEAEEDHVLNDSENYSEGQ